MSNAVASERESSTVHDAVPSVLVDDLHLTYRVFKDQRPTLRRFVANGLRPRPYTPVYALRGVSLVARPGDSIGVVGPNGSGKSTLLKTIAGLLPATKGAVYAHDIPVLLGVRAALQQELSGRRNIYLGGTALGIPRRVLDERFDEIVEFAGLEEFIDLPLRAYSSGMVARLHFSIATAVTPEILLIDEALSTGDFAFKQKSSQRIREMLDSAGTVFVVSHSSGTIKELCNRAVWLERGEIVAEGDPETIVDEYEAQARES